jgi:hypothetical protein
MDPRIRIHTKISWIRKTTPIPKPYFSELSDNFWVKYTIIASELAHIFFFTRSKIKLFSICDICGYKEKVGQQKIFVAVFGSEIRDPG